MAEGADIHLDQIERYGGATGTRDVALLESALAMPAASFGGEPLHAGLHEMAAAYAFHICQNHPFVDGNKRTALACALVFLDLNGVALIDPQQRLYDTISEVASGRLEKRGLADVFRSLTQV
ncbi:MAG: type II toxin-antitoxin system death-on-curing family toxin [bacterium]|nr:type II toxin-antitoxin system death-on-curing family toxin [bacterium]